MTQTGHGGRVLPDGDAGLPALPAVSPSACTRPLRATLPALAGTHRRNDSAQFSASEGFRARKKNIGVKMPALPPSTRASAALFSSVLTAREPSGNSRSIRSVRACAEGSKGSGRGPPGRGTRAFPDRSPKRSHGLRGPRTRQSAKPHKSPTWRRFPAARPPP